MFRIIAIFCIMVAGPLMGQDLSHDGGTGIPQNKTEWQKKKNYIVRAV